jgi:IS5 family transposase
VRLRQRLVTRGPDKDLFDEVTRQFKAKAVRVKTGMLVDATVITSASEVMETRAGRATRNAKRT